MAHRARRWRVLAVALLSGLAGFAQAQAADPPTQPASVSPDCPPPPRALTAEGFDAGIRDAKDRGFLWRIRKDGRTSHLYGTIHAARYEWMFPGPLLRQALAASDIVALELDPLDAGIRKRMQASIGARRGERLPAALAERITRMMTAACIDAAAWSASAPEFQMALLAIAAARQEGLEPSHAIDLALAIHGRRLAKVVLSLETPESQMQALRMPTREQTLDFVAAGLADFDANRVRPLLRRLAGSWAESNFDDLASYQEWCECLRTETEREAMRRLNDERNVELAARIDALHIAGRSVFAAVGSLHMIGPNGLPALMQGRGFEVERVGFGR